jgi:hypothetical protein
MNANYLLKDELSYELGVRGFRTEADTQVLRKRFRSCGTEDFVVDISYLCERGFRELYSKASEKIYALQDSVERQPRNVSRWQTRVQHLKGRLTHLTYAELQLTEAEQRSVRTLLGLLADAEHKMATALESQESQATQERVRTTEGDEEVPKPRATELPSGPEIVTNPVTSGEVRPTQGVSFPPLTSEFYQKIPNPFGNIIKELPIIDGSQISRLWEFIVKTLRLSKMGQLNSAAIYEVLYPFCKEEVLELLMECVTHRQPFDYFHEQLLTLFLPEGQRALLRMEKYERGQAEGEILGSIFRTSGRPR